MIVTGKQKATYELFAKEYPDRTILILRPQGSLYAGDFIFNRGAEKLKALFSDDTNGDNILSQVFDYLCNNLPEEEVRRITDNAKAFAQRFQS